MGPLLRSPVASKDELAGYFKLLASHGFAVAAPRYSLAPGHRSRHRCAS